MKLDEFMEETGIPVRKLAKRCGLGWNQISKDRNGLMPKRTTALRIEIYTNGKVSMEDLIPEDALKEVYDNFKHTNGKNKKK